MNQTIVTTIQADIMGLRELNDPGSMFYGTFQSKNWHEMKNIHDFKGLFIQQLKEQYHGERQQLEVLPKLREMTSAVELQNSIDLLLGKTKDQMKRIEEILRILEKNLHGEENIGVKGLVQEALGLEMRCTEKRVRDAAIITAIQHLLHHNIASYGTLCTYAEELEFYSIKNILATCLEDEKKADANLTNLAEDIINLKALH